MFTVMGLPKVQWGGYFGNELFGEAFMPRGISGLLEASAFLTYATGGATVTLLIQAWMNLQGLTMGVIMLNVVSFVVFWGLATYMYKSGKVHMNPSYELVD